jgi:hypothetical protein
MNILQITAFLLIFGNMLIVTGFGTFPYIIYIGNDVQEKLDLLTAQPQRWILSQLLVISGGIFFVAGSVFLFLLFRESQGFLPAGIGVVGFVLGQVFWMWIVRMRIIEPWRQAKDEFPGWLYKAFSYLTLLGLAGFGIAFWIQEIRPVLGIGISFGAFALLGLFLMFKGMPPIVYYLPTLIIGLALLV